MRKIFAGTAILILFLVWIEWNNDSSKSLDSIEISPEVPEARVSQNNNESNEPQRLPVDTSAVSDNLDLKEQGQQIQSEASIEDGAAVIAGFFNGPDVPKNANELILKAKPLRIPVFPGKPGFKDGTLTGVFKGYIQGSLDQGYRRIKISSAFSGNGGAFDSTVLMELKNGWFVADSERGLKQSNFKDDLYSLVYGLPDGRIIYLKIFQSIFHEQASNKLRVLSGWVYTPAKNVVERMALIDDIADPHGDDLWPELNEIQPYLPKELLP